MRGRVLVIAGSDSSGGAGIQADIKTITALGGYAATAITAITVQNTLGVQSVNQIASSIIRSQMITVLNDIGADTIKIGMIGDTSALEVIAETLERYAQGVPVILDPVLVATSGDALASEGMADMLMTYLVPLSYMVTPNAEEAAVLTKRKILSPADLYDAGKVICTAGSETALMKGGHLDGEMVTDVLVTQAEEIIFQNPRLETTSTHGTGCTLASAIAVGLAQGMSLRDAVDRAIQYVRDAIKAAPGFGAGAGPLNHIPPGILR